MRFIHRKENGYIALVAALTLMLFSLFALSSMSLVNDAAVDKSNSQSRRQAFYYTQTGAEYAKRRIDQGQNPVVTNFAMPKGTFTVAVTAPTVTVTGTSDIANVTHNFQTNFAGSGTGPSGEGCIYINCESMHSAGPNLVDIKLMKACLATPTITDFRLSWTPNLGEEFIKIMIEGDKIYDDAGGTASGVWVNTTDWTFMENPPQAPSNKIEFSSNIPNGKTYTFTYKFQDQSVGSAACVDD